MSAGLGEVWGHVSGHFGHFCSGGPGPLGLCRRTDAGQGWGEGPGQQAPGHGDWGLSLVRSAQAMQTQAKPSQSSRECNQADAHEAQAKAAGTDTATQDFLSDTGEKELRRMAQQAHKATMTALNAPAGQSIIRTCKCKGRF